MTQADPHRDDDLLDTFQVLARFCIETPTVEAAVALVRRMLAAAEEHPSEVRLERAEGPGSWMIVARFVVVSVDAHTAVLGVTEALAVVRPDEVWARSQRPLSRDRRTSEIDLRSASGRRLLTNQ